MEFCEHFVVLSQYKSEELLVWFFGWKYLFKATN